MQFNVTKKLKLLCKNKNISYYELSKKAGISNSTIYNIVNGNTKPRLDTLQDICQALEVNIIDIFTEVPETDEIKNITAEDRELIEKIFLLPPEKKQKIKQYVNMMYQYHQDSEK